MSDAVLDKPKTDRGFLGSKLLAINTILLVVSVIFNVLLAYKLQQQNSSVVATRAQNMLAAGVNVPPITARRWGEERQESLSFADAGRPTVLYVFTPACVWCERNSDSINELVAQKSDKYRFIGLSLSKGGLEEYLTTHPLTMPIYWDLSKDSTSAYKLGGAPQTLVISPDGKVIKNWKGAYTGAQQSEVESFFQVKLPGLQNDSQ